MTKTKKTVKNKVEQAVVEPVIELVEEVKEEANEVVATPLIKRWQVGLAASILTVVLIAVIL